MENFEKRFETFQNENAHNVLIPNNAVIYSCGNGKKYTGFAVGGYFASAAFIEGDEEFNEICGTSFGWYDFEDNQVYRGHRSDFRRPDFTEWITVFSEEQRISCWESLK